MRIKRINKGYTLFASEHEYKILTRILAHFDIDKEWPDMPSGERRSWSSRIRRGGFLRVDHDYRTEKY